MSLGTNRRTGNSLRQQTERYKVGRKLNISIIEYKTPINSYGIGETS